MAYVDSKNTAARGPAVIGVAAIHAALGVAIITGLAGTVVERITDAPITTVFVPKPPPPPPEPVEQQQQKKNTSQSLPVVTDPAINVAVKPPPIDTTGLLPPIGPIDLGPIIAPPLNPGTGTGTNPANLFDPAPPKARNDPGAWITNNDYRSSWINREWAGTAGFRLKVSANGRVEQCTITNSTGHAALDTATCKLVERRARFEPAKNEKGEKVSGTFSSAVRWQIPE